MKPSFALDLRFSVIALLHRTARGWIKVGDAAIEAPDLVEVLAALRSTALGLSPQGITTKVILPNSQLLYTQLKATVAEPSARSRLIAQALDGLTPYRPDELAYDWCVSGSGLQLALVAKETLQEAETFARTHRFNPVSFVAVPEAGSFTGEPFFGRSELSLSLLTKDEMVERDSEPVAEARDVTLPLAPRATQMLPEKPAKTDIPAPPDAPIPPHLAQPSAAKPDVPVLSDVTGPAEAEAQGLLRSYPATAVQAPPAPMLIDAPPPEAEDASPTPLTPTAQRSAPPNPPRAEAEQPAKLIALRDAPLRMVGSAVPTGTPAIGAQGKAAPVPRPSAAKPLPVAPTARPTVARPWQRATAQTAKTRPFGGADLGKSNALPAQGRVSSAKTVAQQRRSIIVILTAVLVLLLGIVALWAALSLSTNEANNRAPSPVPVVVQEPNLSAPDTVPAAQSAQTPNPLATPDRKTPAVDEPPLPQTAKSEPAPVSQDVTKTSAALAEGSDGQDEIFLASADTPPRNLDPIALPALQGAADAAPAIPDSPPPYLALDPPPAALTPSPQGMTTPKLALNAAELPPIDPIGRPQDLTLAPPLDPSVNSQAAPPEEPTQPPLSPPQLAQDPTLADKRPLARPGDLVAAQAVPNTADRLAPSDALASSDVTAPDSRYAKLRPRARPADLEPAPAAEPTGTAPLVLTSSPIPQARPTNLTPGVNDAVDVALNQVPQTESAAPTLPSNASVAKQATERLALNANRVALLAVFGTPTSRYAMVRLAGGRVKKVQVGDQVDGGSIAGITADSVQYQKGSRIVTLSLPQG